MEQNKAEQLLAIYGSKIPLSGFLYLREWLKDKDYETAAMHFAHMKDPVISLVLSVLVGLYGIDRFYVGDIGLGVLKLITCGGAGIWWLVDLFIIMDRTKEKNIEFLYMN